MGRTSALQKFLIVGQMVVLWSIKIGCLFKLNDLHFHLRFLSFGVFLALRAAKMQSPCRLLIYWGQGAINPNTTYRDKAELCRTVHSKVQIYCYSNYFSPWIYLHITLKVGLCGSTSFYLNMLNVWLPSPS